MTVFLDGLVGIGKPFVYNIVVVTPFALRSYNIVALLFQVAQIAHSTFKLPI
jgi:hypothetical protein